MSYVPGQTIQQGVPQQDPYIALANAQPDGTMEAQLAQAEALRAQPLKTNNMAGRVVQRVSPFAALANGAQNVIAQTQVQKAIAAQQQQAQLLRSTRGRIISDEEARQNLATDPSKNHPDTNMQLMQAQDPQAQSTMANLGLGDGNMSPSIPGQ